jgi:predicted  nucleic acid-binding Zn-ribbon protein
LKNYLTDANNIGGEKQLPTKEGVTELYKLLNNATLNQNGSLVIKVPNPNYTKTMESLQESVEKDLADINKEAEHEVLQAKLDKIDALIDHRRSKLSKLDEDEDMKALTDKKKVKELEKDIKKLEVARKKIEKMMSKFKGKKAESKEVIDETENDGLDQQTVNDITTKYNEIYIKNGVVTDREIEDIAEQYPFDQKTDIMDYLEGYSPADEFDM